LYEVWDAPGLATESAGADPEVEIERDGAADPEEEAVTAVEAATVEDAPVTEAEDHHADSTGAEEEDPREEEAPTFRPERHE